MQQRSSSRPTMLVAGLVLLLVGVVFLLGNAGIFAVAGWLLGPLLLIGLGVVVLVAALRGGRGGTGETASTVAMDGATRLELRLRIGAGRYHLAAGTSGALVAATSDQPTIATEVDRAGDLARVRLTTAVEPWHPGSWGGHSWEIGIAPGVPTVLDVQAGAGDFDLDLSSIAIASASIGIGAAELAVTLPHPRGEVPIRVDGGAAQFTFRVPPGVEARVATNGLLTTSGPTQTPGYAGATDRVSVHVSGGIASVRVVPSA
jgi:hypothetical protein